MMRPSHALPFCLLLFFSSPLAAQPPTTQAAGGSHPPACTSAQIAFDNSSVEHILLRPEDILANPDRFWKEDSAYSRVKAWHEMNDIPIPFDKWREIIAKVASTPAGERSGNAEYWHGDLQHLLNAITHEVFHIGYGRNPTSQMLSSQSDDRYYLLRRSLQNEGMATYVAYKAVAIYPAAGEKDYQLLDNPMDVVELRHKLNALFREAAALPDSEMQQRSWDIGVMQRAYYIVGADMARTIEEKVGRRPLVDTITKGPRTFVTTYNACVPDSERIVELP